MSIEGHSSRRRARSAATVLPVATRSSRPQPAPAGPVVPGPAAPALTRATLADVARLAGVSGKTASRVISGQTTSAPDTRQRVMDAAQRLRFRPNHLARDLRRGGVSTTVAFVMGDLTNPFYSGVAAGIEKELAGHGLTMVIAATDDEPSHEERVVAAMLERRVRSLLIVPIAADQSYLEGERQLGTPVVCIDRPAQNLAADSVVFANHDGAAAATNVFIEQGHRRIAFIGSSSTLYTHGERLAGYRHALLDAGLGGSRRWERTDAPDAASAEAAVHDLLAGPEAPTAILAGNNRASTGVLRALRESDPRSRSSASTTSTSPTPSASLSSRTIPRTWAAKPPASPLPGRTTSPRRPPRSSFPPRSSAVARARHHLPDPA